MYCLSKKRLGIHIPKSHSWLRDCSPRENHFRGWHKKAGESHAEKEAIEKIKDKSILNEVTLYVNLEPCNHFGKHLLVQI